MLQAILKDATTQSRNPSLFKSPQEINRVEIIGSTYCAKTRFISELLEEEDVACTLKTFPLGYIHSDLVYDTLPAIRLVSTAGSVGAWIEDLRLIWYQLEGRFISTSECEKAYAVIEDFLQTPFTKLQRQIIYQHNHQLLKKQLENSNLTFFQKQVYRYHIWPGYLKTMKLYDRAEPPAAADGKQFAVNSESDLDAKSLKKIKARSQRAQAFITTLLQQISH